MYGPYDLSELYHNFAEASGQELGPKALSEEWLWMILHMNVSHA